MCMCTDVFEDHFVEEILNIVRCSVNVKGIFMAGVQYGFRLCPLVYLFFTNLISFHKKSKYSERF